jgi:hypothetical protein
MGDELRLFVEFAAWRVPYIPNNSLSSRIERVLTDLGIQIFMQSSNTGTGEGKEPWCHARVRRP